VKNFQLSDTELETLRVAHRDCRDKRSAYRVNAVILLGCGWTTKQVSDALLIDEGTLRTYVKRYRKGGVDKLLQDHYSGGLSYLTVVQKQELVLHLDEQTYLDTKAIIRYVERHYGVSYSVSGMTDLLHALGFSYKKPKIVPGKADPQAQREFLKGYEKLKEDKGEKDPIYFMDGVHPQHNTQASYGWIKRGEQKEIKSNSGRQRLNINGAINLETLSCATVMDDAVNADSTIELLKRLERKHTKAEAIYIICDNARYYRSRKVKAYLENSRIELVFLPPYSPNLNLIERYWKYFKKVVLYNRYYEKFDEFKSACLAFFQNTKQHKKALRSLLTENFHIMGECAL
jgi:transposase